MASAGRASRGGCASCSPPALCAACRAKEQTEEEIRLLIAYGRGFAEPRLVPLADLAAAAAMSVSGAGTAYDHIDVDTVAASTGVKPGTGAHPTHRRPMASWLLRTRP